MASTALDLPRILRRQNKRRSRPFDVRAVDSSTVAAADLAKIYSKVIAAWLVHIRDMVLPLYARTLAEAKPTQDAFTRDDIPELTGAMGSAEDMIDRVIIRLGEDARKWAAKVERIHRQRFSSNTRAATGVNVAPLISEESVQDLVLATIQQNTQLIRNVSDTVRQRAADAIYRGYVNRTPFRTVAKQISEATGIQRARALRIASDQNVKLSAALDQRRQEELGIEEFTWVHSGKVHFRPEHKARDGQVFRWDDPTLAEDLPGMAINCGCKAKAHISLQDEV